MIPAWLNRQSIATRLLLSAGFWSLAILLIAGLALSAIYRRGAEQAFDTRLGFYLKALVADVAAFTEDSKAAPGQLGEPQFELSLSGWYWQITRLGGADADIKSSRSLFAARLPRLAQGAALGDPGVRRGYITGPDDRRLRIVERTVDAGDSGLFLIQVAAQTEEIENDIGNFELTLGLTFALLALALIGSAVSQVRFGLAPLRRLQKAIGDIRSGESARIDEALPGDIAPLADEMNLLISSNHEIVERARTHVGNLAHALKTPLSVIANEARADAGPFAEKVLGQTGVMRHQIDYYLNRARAAARAAATGSVTPVAPVIAALHRTFEKIYDERGLDFEVACPDDLRFRGERQDLEEMIGNLLDNGAKWTAGRIRLSAEAEAQGGPGERAFFTVTLDDDGAGLAPAEREAAARRGQRLDESKPGSGLGLSIVTDLAALYGGSLTLEDGPLGGLRARLRLPVV